MVRKHARSGLVGALQGGPLVDEFRVQQQRRDGVRLRGAGRPECASGTCSGDKGPGSLALLGQNFYLQATSWPSAGKLGGGRARLWRPTA